MKHLTDRAIKSVKVEINTSVQNPSPQKMYPAKLLSQQKKNFNDNYR